MKFTRCSHDYWCGEEHGGRRQCATLRYCSTSRIGLHCNDSSLWCTCAHFTRWPPVRRRTEENDARALISWRWQTVASRDVDPGPPVAALVSIASQLGCLDAACLPLAHCLPLVHHHCWLLTTTWWVVYHIAWRLLRRGYCRCACCACLWFTDDWTPCWISPHTRADIRCGPHYASPLALTHIRLTSYALLLPRCQGELGRASFRHGYAWRWR